MVSIWILEEVELVIVLGIIPLSSLDDLGDDLLAPGCEMLGLDLLRDALGNACLLRTVREDGGPILCEQTRVRRHSTTQS